MLFQMCSINFLSTYNELIVKGSDTSEGENMMGFSTVVLRGTALLPAEWTQSLSSRCCPRRDPLFMSGLNAEI